MTDQMGRTLSHVPPDTPRRIVSLVPSQTELLHALGLDAEVVGITKFCTHPEAWYRTKARVGGTKDYRPERIAALCPDLILGNKEENEAASIAALDRDYPVWMSDIATLSDALDMIERVGALVGRVEAAQSLAAEIRAAWTSLEGLPRQRAAYFIWRKPYMVAAGDTFIDAMLDAAGFDNAFAGVRRYPEVTLDALADSCPDCIFLSSEPYPFKAQHLAEFRAACPTADVRCVDGTYFSWYGSRLRHAPDYFLALRH